MDNEAIEAHLNDSLQKNLIYLHYQPKVDILTRKICGAEALIRLPHLNGVYVQPSKIISLAEQNGQIVAIGEAVLREACRGILEMSKLGIMLPVSVNVSVAQILHENFFDTVVNIMSDFNLINKPELLEIEITESIMINDPCLVVGVLQKLSSIGIRLSLDDFGVGFSSLNQLKMLPVTGIKIDKSFVDNIVSGEKDQAIVKIIIALAREFLLSILAEGVETQPQADWLEKNGCHHAQGYLYGKPSGLDTFIALCAK